MQTNISRNVRRLIQKYSADVIFLIVWFVLSCAIFFIEPSHTSNTATTVLAVRTYTIIQIYAVGMWVIWSHQQPMLFTLFGGLLVLYCGLLICYFTSYSISSSLFNLPPVYILAFALLLYLGFWCSLRALLQSISNSPCLVVMIYTIIWLFMLGNLLCLHYLPIWFPEQGSQLVSVGLYLNPAVLCSRYFPDYDYLRGMFFYELYGTTADLGPFQYPNLQWANIGYGCFIFLASISAKIISALNSPLEKDGSNL